MLDPTYELTHLGLSICSIADPHCFDADRDQDLHFDADPDPHHFNADPAPDQSDEYLSYKPSTALL